MSSDTIQNPKKDGNYMSFTIRSSKFFPEPRPENIEQEESIERDVEEELTQKLWMA